jgi:alpha-D-ribose 1-methylphosphonate 5-triphosphate synthase subunit PhnG
MDDGEPSAPKDRLSAGLASFNASRAGMRQLAASVGGFSFAAGSSGSLAELMALADAAMYTEKRARKAV